VASAVVVLGLASLAFLLLVYAALHDFAARTVPNWLPICVFLVGAAWRLFDHSLLAGLAVAAITFVILFAVWLAGAIGGGDAKLWPATAMLIPPYVQPELNFFVRVFLIGGLLALVYLALWLVLPKMRRGPASRAAGLGRRVLRAEAWRIGRRGPLPYALAISGSAIITLLPFSLTH
jgi:prepilin peptidase CpaA